MSKKLIAESESKETFFASMSHEMRNPLNSLLGTLEIIKLNLASGQPIDPKILQSAQFSGETLVNLIGNILDFSKIRGNKMDIVLSLTDVRERLSNILAMYSQLAIKKGISLEYLPDFTLPASLQLDHNKLNQCLVNLVGNSIKFTPKGGIIVVKTSWTPISNENLDHFQIKQNVDNILTQSSREDILTNVDMIKNPSNQILPLHRSIIKNARKKLCNK